MDENMDNTYELSDEDVELLCGAGVVDDVCEWVRRKLRELTGPVKRTSPTNF